MYKIIVLNTKGGAGKTTIATNLASLYAAHGYKTALIDHDPQGSSSSWLKRRTEEAAPIYGIAAHQQSSWSVTRSWQMRLPHDMERVIVDTPAGIKSHDVSTYLKDASVIAVPVLSSLIDIEASAIFVHDVMRVIKSRSSRTRLVVVANRARPRSPALHVMSKLFADMNIQVVGHLRDSNKYLQCTDLGLGVHDLPSDRAQYERRALSEMVTQIDQEFGQQSHDECDRQRVITPLREVSITLPHATAARYGLSWK